MDDFLPVAEQLRILFEAITRPDGSPFTLQEVSRATGISLGTISHLRTGKIANPGLNTLRELCRFFGVPLRYFETQTVEECYAIVAEETITESPSLNEIAFRATKLSPKAQQDVLAIIKWVQAADERRRAGEEEMPDLPGLTEFDEGNAGD